MRRVLFLVAHPIEDASRRYRIQQFIPLLERAGYTCTISQFATPKLFRALRSHGKLATKVIHTLYCSMRRLARLTRLSQFDVVVVHREVFPFFTPLLEKYVLQMHRKVIFSLDDAIYTTHPECTQLNHPMLYRFKYGRKVHEIVRQSAHVIAGNRTLAEYAKKYNSRVTMLPTVVDCEQYHYKSVKHGTEPLTIGWMGSRSTSSYLFSIAGALRKLAKTCGQRLQFRFIGDDAIDLTLPDASYAPFRLESELDDLHSFDIGLMPMPDTEWTRGKCAFKAIQYMAAGIPTVASPIGATLDLIQHGRNGLLAASNDEWYSALAQLIRDASMRERFSLCGRKTVEESYSLCKWGPKFVSLIDEVVESPVSCTPCRSEWNRSEVSPRNMES